MPFQLQLLLYVCHTFWMPHRDTFIFTFFFPAVSRVSESSCYIASVIISCYPCYS
jgi:hypothetical protein